MIILFSCLPTKLGNEDCSYMSIYMMLKSEHRKYDISAWAGLGMVNMEEEKLYAIWQYEYKLQDTNSEHGKN